MYWLALHRDWTSLSTLQSSIMPVVLRTELLAALESLHQRSLIEIQAHHYTQPSIVMEYVTQQFMEQVGAEFTAVETGPGSVHSKPETRNGRNGLRDKFLQGRFQGMEFFA
jgi:hypothetical protein